MRLYSLSLIPLVAATINACDPGLRFNRSPIMGGRPLAVTCTLYHVDGDPLPEGTCYWQLDDEVESGPISTHCEWTHQFTTPGIHTIELSVETDGAEGATPVPVGESGEFQAIVIVLPRVSGHVRDEAGNGIAGVTVSASSFGSTCLSDASGFYEVNAAFNYSFELRPQHPEIVFSPACRTYTAIQDDLTGQDFVRASSTGAFCANAGPDQTAGLGTTVFLDGSGSLDGQGGANLSYQWAQIDGPSIALTNPTTAKPKFTAPQGSTTTTYSLTFRLTVTDNVSGATATDTVGITVTFTRQSVLKRIHLAALGHYDYAVRFPDGQGGAYLGWAESRTVDSGTQWYANEAGTWAKAGPMIGMQPPATSSIGQVYLHAFDATGNKHYLALAEETGDTLLTIQDAWNGGWHYDMIFENGEWRAVMVWQDLRRDYTTDSFLGMLHGAVTLDDGISQAAALFLLRLHQVSGKTKYLDGAKRFGNLLVNLKDVRDSASGQYPYRNGGIPQVMPLDVAMGIVFTGEDGTPGEHYYVHKTVNDFTMQQAILFLMELYEATGSSQYRDAVRLNIDYLLDRHAAYGNRGWCQQYHYLTNEPAWGRHKEPPAFVSGEDGIIDLLLAWWERETDATRRQSIENAVHSALMYWEHEALRANPSETDVAKWLWWRYYNTPRTGYPFTNPGRDNRPINEIIFSDEYVNYYGVENEDHAAPGQPWQLGDPRRWLLRILDAQDNLDLSELSKYRSYFDADNVFKIFGTSFESVYNSQDVASGLWTGTCTLDGQTRVKACAGTNASYLTTLIGELDDCTGPVTDSDCDGCSDAQESGAGTDPFDSRSHP
ncbi:MAG: hypothetical protein JXQ73_25805 [Phycisphaerae bacterium]|nr:hypothetical protein [Phycisphaerae bacterium]